MVNGYLRENRVYEGDCTGLLGRIRPGSVALSLWAPPRHTGRTDGAGRTYDEWRDLIRAAAAPHAGILRPGGFLVIDAADILAFPDETMPRIQAENPSRTRAKVTRAQILGILAEHPGYNHRKLAGMLGVSEQTIARRLNGNNARGGKRSVQTRIQPVGPLIEQAMTEAGLYMYDLRVWNREPAWSSSQWYLNSYRSVDDHGYLYVAWKPGPTLIDRDKLTRDEWTAWGSRGVWDIRPDRRVDGDDARFPIELAKRVIRLYSEPGDLVIDPFDGRGTTTMAAAQLGRRYIGIELDPARAREARENTESYATKLF